jgi:hypothetical protein
MQLKEVLDKYDAIEAQMLYDKAVEILSLISNEELEDILRNHAVLFSKISSLPHEQLLSDKETIRKAIDIFIQTIESRNLTKDEFDAMTLDDVKDYIDSIITIKSPSLLRLINEIEEISLKYDTRVKAN